MILKVVSGIDLILLIIYKVRRINKIFDTQSSSPAPRSVMGSLLQKPSQPSAAVKLQGIAASTLRKSGVPHLLLNAHHHHPTRRA